MYKINGPGATGDGHFTDGNPVGGIPATVVTDDFMNDVQDELLNILAAAGVTPAINTPNQVLASLAVLLGGHGRCRLSVASTTSLSLKPLGGNTVVVNGGILRIPAAGISVTNSGLAANTTYYVYLSGTTAAPVLELSATGHSTHTNGVEIKTGDPTRTLVGMVRTDASILFVDSALLRYCINWFNRRSISCSTYGVGFTVTGGGEVSSTLRNQFLTWADEAVDSVANALAVLNTTAARIDFTLSANSATNSSQPEGFGRVTCSATTAAATYAVPLNKSGRGVLPEGVGYTTAYSGVSSGNALVTIDIMTIIRG
jgi:hypothetical protein